MASGKRKDQSIRRAQARAAVAAPMAAEPGLLGPWQRRVVLMLLLSGLALGAAGTFVAPRGGGYWAAVTLAPMVAALVGFILGGAPTRAINARLLQAPQAGPAPPPPAPAALAPPLRDALQAALRPALLSALAGAAQRMAPRERAAALALVEAGATAPAGEARAALARDLPRLVPALAAGGSAAAAEAEDLARRLALPAASAGGAR